MFKNIYSSPQLEVNETIADDIIHSIVKLYIQVRALPFRRDIAQEDRI